MKKWILMILMGLFFSVGVLEAKDKNVLNLEINNTIAKLELKAKGAREFLQKAQGYLVIPELYKAGFVVGGEYGEGALLIGNKIVDYYSVISASIGFQAGAQVRSLIIVFLTPKSLEDFRRKNRWKVGVDGSIAFVDWGKGIDLSTMDFKKPIIAFMFDNKGLMAGVSIDGSVFTRISK